MKKNKGLNPFDKIIDELKQLEEMVKNEESQKLKVFSRHNVMILQDLNNLKIVWNRFIKTREDLFEVDHIERFLYEAKNKKKLTEKGERKLKTIWKKQSYLTKQLRVDFISLFLFLDIYLNKL